MSLPPFYRGDTKEYPFAFTFGGAPVDISGKKLYFTVKTDIADADGAAVLTKVLGPFTGPEAVAGTGTLVLTSTDTNALLGKYVFDFELRDETVSPHHVTTLAKGNLTVLADVHRGA
jgi:hypothetical protein